jgi:hypothetical protein
MRHKAVWSVNLEEIAPGRYSLSWVEQRGVGGRPVTVVLDQADMLRSLHDDRYLYNIMMNNGRD